MTILLVCIGILILVIFGLIFRTLNLLDVFGGTFRKRSGLSNQINALMFPIFFVVLFGGMLLYNPIAQKEFLPEASSVHGKQTDAAFWLTMAIIGLVFFVTHILLFFFPYRFQFREDRKAYFFPDNNALEMIWTIIPAIVLSVLIFSGWKLWSEITGPEPQGSYQIELTGKQFAWMVRYPGKDLQLGKHNFHKIDATNEVGIDYNDANSIDDFMANEIHLPKGKPVILKIRARDVLHSVYMPHFRVKMDAVPGMPTRFWFTPDKTTAEMRSELGNPKFNYELACAEVCGRNHFGMRKVIVVEEEDEYLAWLNSQKSFLTSNPDYIKQVPDKLKSKAAEQMAPPAPARAETPAATPAPTTQASL